MKGKFLMTSVLLIGASLWFNTAEAQQKNENQKSEIRGSLNVTTDRWDGSGDMHINYVEDGHRYKIRLKGSRIMEMYLDEKKVPEEEFAKYESLVKKILVQIEKDREQADKDRVRAERDREQADRDRAQAEKDRQQADRDRDQARKDREQAERERQHVKDEREKADHGRDQAEQDRKQAEKDLVQAQLDRKQAEKDREQAERDRGQADQDRKQAEEERKLFEAMIEEMIKEKLVESRDAITSLELDETGLFINRKEQPENVYNRYKQKYLKGKNKRIYYRNSGSSLNISFE